MARKTIFFSIFLVLSCKAASACTCIQSPHRDEFRRSAAVFSAKVIDITEDVSYVPPKIDKVPPGFQKMIASSKRHIVRLVVEKNFKGVAAKEILMYAFTSDGSCSGIMFLPGEKYLIYADFEDGWLWYGGICSRTSSLNKTSNEYRELERSSIKWSQ